MMKRRITRTVVAALLLMSVAGCGSKTPEPKVSSNDTQATKNDTTQNASTPNSATESKETEVSNLNLEGYPVVKEPITISITGKMNGSTTTWEKLPQLEFLSELTGVKIQAQGISSEAWKQQRGLILASDSLADLFVSTDYSKEEYLKYGKEGIFIPLNDLIDKYMPNLKAAMEEFPEAKALITNADGTIYALPRIAPVVRDMHNRYWLNEAWVKRLGLKMPETLDEYYNILKAFKEQDANGNGDATDEIPLSGYEGRDANLGLVLNALGVNASNDTYGYTTDENGNVYCVNTSEGYKDYLKFMNKLYKEQLLDQEFFTQTNEQWKAKAQENIIGATRSAAMYATAGTEIGYDFTQIDGLTSDRNKTPMVTSWNTISLVGAISKNNKSPEATARMLDYLYSKEGGILAYVGVENVSWKWIDKANGKWDKIAPEGYETAEMYRGVSCIVNGLPSYETMEFNLGQGSDNALWLNGMSVKSSKYFVPAFPASYLALSTDDAELISGYAPDLTTYCAQMRGDFITGNRDIDAEWDAYVSKVDKMGVSEVLPIYQKAYKAYLETVK